MQNLPALNSVKQCPKCGCTGLGNQCKYLFVRGNKYYSETVSNRPSEQKSVLERRRAEGSPDEDCMQRTCPRCGYVWHEACADYTEAIIDSGLGSHAGSAQEGLTNNAGCPSSGSSSNYPEMFTQEHFESADKIGQNLISNLKEKGYTKSSSTKCPASQDLFNLNHSRINLYCSLPRGHNGQHQITLQDSNKYLIQWTWTDEPYKDNFISTVDSQATEGIKAKLEIDKESTTKEAAEARAEMISNSLFGMFRHKANNDSDDED